MTTFGLSVANLRHRRLRVAIGMLSIAVSFAMMCLSLSATRRVRGSLAGFDEKGLLITAYRDGNLPYAFIAQLRNTLGPQADLQWNAFAGGGVKGTQIFFGIIGQSPDYFGSYPAVIRSYDPGAFERWKDDRQGLLVADDIMARTGWKVGDTVILETRDGDIQGHVSGTTRGAIRTMIAMHYEYLDSLRKAGAGRVDSVVVHGLDDPNAAIAKTQERFANVEPALLIAHERAFHAYIMSISGALPDLLEKVALVFGFCALLLVFSNAYVSLRERRAEFGALRAIGFTRTRILFVIVGEFIALCLGAGLIGCGIPYLLLSKEGIKLGQFALERVTLDPTACLSVFVGGVVLGSLITLLPALSLSRTKTTELLESR